MDPFHVVRLAGDALDECRRRVQQDLHGHRGHAGDPLYRARRTLHTGEDLLTDKQKARIDALFADENHLQVQVTWAIYQRMIAAYRDPDRAAGRTRIRSLIDSLTRGVPAVLVEIRQLGRTLNRRAPTSSRSSTDPAPATDPQKPSTAAWNTSAASPSDSATSPTTSPDPYSKSADSRPDYTFVCDEPVSPPGPGHSRAAWIVRPMIRFPVAASGCW